MTLAKVQSDQTSGQALERILQAAEFEFAEKGFEGAGMKALAQRAGVSQSLLHYHFGSKDQLYSAVIRERSKAINDERLERLDAIDLSDKDALDQVIKALFIPALGPAGGGRAYARIFAGLIAGNERDRTLVRECYDPTAQKFLEAIDATFEGGDRESAAQIYQFALGVLASVISRDGRVERLMGNEGTRMDDDMLIEKIVRFVVGGAQAIRGP